VTRVGDNVRLRLALLTALLPACGGRTIALDRLDGGDAPVASPSGDGGLAGPSLPTDASPTHDPAADLLAACSGERNVFHYDVKAYPGPFSLGAKRFTNHDARWYTQLQPDLGVVVSAGSGAGGSINVWMPYGTALVAGTYPQGPATANVGPSLHAMFGGGSCEIESGMLTIVELTSSDDDAGAPHLDTFVASFDLACKWWEPTPIPIRGCIRYAKSP
jgi:hypothetical protein